MKNSVKSLVCLAHKKTPLDTLKRARKEYDILHIDFQVYGDVYRIISDILVSRNKVDMAICCILETKLRGGCTVGMNYTKREMFYRKLQISIIWICRKGYLASVKKIMEHDAIFCVSIIENNHLPIIRYFCELGSLYKTHHYDWRIRAMEHSASIGNLSIVKYLFEQIKFFTQDTLTRAAREGHLNVVKYLCETGRDAAFHSNLPMDYASERGFLDIVKCLHEKIDAPYTTYSLTMAAKNGHLTVVQYLFQEVSVPYTMTTLLYTNHHSILDYLTRYKISHTDIFDNVFYFYNKESIAKSAYGTYRRQSVNYTFIEMFGNNPLAAKTTGLV